MIRISDSLKIALILFVLLGAGPSQAETKLGPPSSARNACTGSESWSFSSTLPMEWQTEMRLFLSQKASPARGFSEALTLRHLAKTDEIRLLAEYWFSRALYEAGLYHVAHEAFSAIASAPMTASTAGVQTAALECLNTIYYQFPSMGLKAEVIQRLPAYFEKASESEVPLDAAAIVLRIQVAEEHPSKDAIEQTLSLLKDGGPYEALSKSLWATRQNKYETTINETKKFLSFKSVPTALRRYGDLAHLNLARAYYVNGQYTQAMNEFKLISKSSNDLAHSLSELAWSQLMSEHYMEAIGTSINLTKGGMRRTFAPESPMIMAIAMNELCQFPESIRAINAFRSSYDKPYQWLNYWYSADKKARTPIYPQAISYLKHKSDVPERIASEWIRSSVFISHQDEINLLFNEKNSATNVGRAAVKEQNALGQAVLKLAQEIQSDVKDARSEAGADGELPDLLHKKLIVLKNQLTHYKRLRRAAPVWLKVKTHHEMRTPGINHALVAKIEADLQSRTVQMFHQLEDVAENNQLIEVEIYNGASQDIIWQNAHPDYKDIAEKIKSETKRANSGKVWDWGRSSVNMGDDDKGEIWEDELGSFRADVTDNCSSKEKYLTLKSSS